MTALLRMEGVTLRRGGRVLLEDFDLEVGPGETVQLSGPNGSGKSSLLRLAAGLLAAERGRVERPAQAALADDTAALDRELPLIAALSFWLPDDGHRRLEAAVNTLDLAGLLGVPVRMLSAGQLKRATLARVAASGAPLWLLDEPSNGLDAQGLSDLAELIDAHTASGGAVLAASHVHLPGEWRHVELGA